MEATPPTAICVRQPSANIAEEIGAKISPFLAEKLAAMPALMGEPEAADGTRFRRKRIAVEFFYEPSPEDRWGDFAQWNITETEIREKTVTITRQHFPNVHA